MLLAGYIFVGVHTLPVLRMTPGLYSCCAAVDALFAVYEASSLELWSFMEYNGLSGSLRSTYAPALYYLMMVFYLVIFVQVGGGWL